jgi:hypothetical protein
MAKMTSQRVLGDPGILIVGQRLSETELERRRTKTLAEALGQGDPPIDRVEECE